MAPYSSCIDACEACVIACDRFSTSPAAGASGRGLKAAIECTQACELAILAMTREARITLATCSVCARLCEECERICLQCADEQARECARACARAAAECQRALRLAAGQPATVGKESPALACA